MHVVSLLKQDVFGRVELVRLGRRELVRRVVAEGGRIPLAGAIARTLLLRERRALAALDGLEGVPRLVEPSERATRDELVRTFVRGEPLHRCRELPLDFFERLEELVRELHARGVAHNDLHKEQNVVVGDDGWPWLIDFQLASVHSPGSRTLRTRALDDLRHIAKHRRRYLRYARVADERFAPAPELLADPPRAPKRRGAALVWRKTAKPLYNFVTRSVLGRRDGEARRETRGEWPSWVRARGPRHSTSSR